jgi:hypothetical protein
MGDNIANDIKEITVLKCGLDLTQNVYCIGPL